MSEEINQYLWDGTGDPDAVDHAAGEFAASLSICRDAAAS